MLKRSRKSTYLLSIYLSVRAMSHAKKHAEKAHSYIQSTEFTMMDYEMHAKMYWTALYNHSLNVLCFPRQICIFIKMTIDDHKSLYFLPLCGIAHVSGQSAMQQTDNIRNK